MTLGIPCASGSSTCLWPIPSSMSACGGRPFLPDLPADLSWEEALNLPADLPRGGVELAG